VSVAKSTILLVVFLASCSRPSSTGEAPTPTPTATPAPAGKHFGDLMFEVGRRFEQAGRAVGAGRWALADYDVGEIEEVFGQDVPTAIMPEDVHIDLLPIAREFANSVPATLHKAIASRDEAAFESAFASASARCNACHEEAGKPFIQVPGKIGVSVPRLDPVAPPSP